MTLTLAINTASQENAVAILMDGRVLNERGWRAQANESQTVLPAVEELLEQEGKAWKDVQRVVAVSGPGSYTSLRVGITLANAIAWSLKVPIAGVRVFEVWEYRIDPAARTEAHCFVVASGKDHYLVHDSAERLTEGEVSDRGVTCYGELPRENTLFKEVARSFGEAIAELTTLGALKFGPVPVEPFYVQPPHITEPKVH